MKVLAPLILLVVFLAAVVVTDDSPADADLVFVNQNEVFTLDPQRMSYVQDLRLAHALYEGLVRWDNHDYTIHPAGAASWRVSEDQRTYTFQLRPEATWSNGAPVTAHDFARSWMRAMLPDTAADYSNLFFTIDGAEAFFRRRVAMTRGFASDPWQATPVDPDVVAAFVDRARRLLDDDDHLPDAIARPELGDRPAVMVELDILADALDDPGRLAVELGNATTLRAWHDRLDEPTSRRAEAEWMWRACETDYARHVGVRAVDDHTLEVTLVRPTAYFLDLLCFGVFFPVHRPTIEGWPADWSGTGAPPFNERRWLDLNSRSGRLEQAHGWARPETHVGNGPYLLAQWRYKRDLRLERNPRYHDQAMIRNDTVLALTIEDNNTAVLAFESGQVDWLVDVKTEYESDMIAELHAYLAAHAEALDTLLARGVTYDDALAQLPPPQAGERRNIHMFPTFGTAFFSFNCREQLANGAPNPFHDAAVRRAFTMAVDKDRIVNQVTRLGEPVATTLIPPNSIPGYRSPVGLPFDIARARAELASAGWLDRDGDGYVENEDGTPFPVIDLLYSTNLPRYEWMCLDLRDQWEPALGVRVELRPLETKFFKEDLKQGKFMIGRGSWYGDYGDPTTFLDLCRTGDGNNDRGFSDPRVDAWLDAAARETDADARLRVLEACEAYIVQDALPMLPVYQISQVYMYDSGAVRGLSSHPRLTQYLWQMQVERP